MDVDIGDCRTAQELIHVKSRLVYPNFEKERVISLTCVYCMDDVFFEVPSYRLQLGPFPLHLVSKHGNPDHDFTIEVYEHGEVKIVKREVNRAQFKVLQEKEKTILSIPILPLRHDFPLQIPQSLKESPNQSPANADTPKPSIMTEKMQETPELPLIQESTMNESSNQIKLLIQKLPQLTPYQIAEELLHITPFFRQIPGLSKVTTEIDNWARDISHMQWTETQVHALIHQLKFWSEKLSQLT